VKKQPLGQERKKSGSSHKQAPVKIDYANQQQSTDATEGKEREDGTAEDNDYERGFCVPKQLKKKR